MRVVYHGSGTGGLAVIAPRASTHGAPYVYATEHRAIAHIFLCRWNDFLLTLDTVPAAGAPHMSLTERYPRAMEDIFGGKGGYLYTIDGADFHSLENGWDMEVVSEREQMPIAYEYVHDVYSALLDMEKAGVLTLFRYPNRPKHIPADDGDLIDKAAELYRLSGDAHNAVYCIKRFPALRDAIIERFHHEFGVDLSTSLERQ